MFQSEHGHGTIGLFLDANGEPVWPRHPQKLYEWKAGSPRVVKISGGDNHLCLLMEDGTLLTLGAASQGQLGRLPPRFAQGSLDEMVGTRKIGRQQQLLSDFVFVKTST